MNQHHIRGSLGLPIHSFIMSLALIIYVSAGVSVHIHWIAQHLIAVTAMQLQVQVMTFSILLLLNVPQTGK